jgi:hypothetical protein
MVLKILRWTASIALVVAGLTLAALAQDPDRLDGRQLRDNPRKIEGRVVRVGPAHLIIGTPDRGEVTVFMRSDTRYLSHDQSTRIAKLPIGSAVSVALAMDGSRLVAETVSLAEDERPTPRARSRSAGPISNKLDRTDDTIDGTILRKLPPDQIDVRTIDGAETRVRTNAATDYEFAGQTGGFSNLRPGDAVSIAFDRRNQQNVARRVAGVLMVEGQVVRTVRPNEVMLRDNAGRDFNVLVVPNTRFLLTPDGGVFNDLRPGTRVAVSFNQVDRRREARRIAIPQGRQVIR